MAARGGPLGGVRVIELVGLGPGPYCGMLLADLGADVLRIDRVATADTQWSTGVLERSKRSAGVDLRNADGVALLLDLVESADVLIDTFRPGVAERRGFGPAECLARNNRLVYGRLTGWGQDGPLAARAGHDITYIAAAGALEPLGRAGQPPTPPIMVLGDFAGGGMLLALGISAALYDVAKTGRGQVIDSAIIDGAAVVMAPFYSGRAAGRWGPRGTNHLDTGAPWYDVYETADARWLAIGALEPQFFAQLLSGLGLSDDPDVTAQHDRTRWPAARVRFADTIRTKSREEWVAVFEGTDACVAPVLDPVEATRHPHAVARQSFVEVDGAPQPRPAPRFSETPLDIPHAGRPGATDTHDALREWGIRDERVKELANARVISA
ncbi:MAG: CaiB/BaiF CoA transferase family protein [Actinomycetes bacterium]